MDYVIKSQFVIEEPVSLFLIKQSQFRYIIFVFGGSQYSLFSVRLICFWSMFPVVLLFSSCNASWGPLLKTHSNINHWSQLGVSDITVCYGPSPVWSSDSPLMPARLIDPPDAVVVSTGSDFSGHGSSAEHRTQISQVPEETTREK